MAKGRLDRDKWHVWDDGSGRFFYAERTVSGKREMRYISAHCLACAKAEVLASYGGKVDLRGSSRSMCGTFLRTMAETVEEEDDE